MSRFGTKTSRASADLADARRFIERWTIAGPAIEEERLLRLQRLDEASARAMTRDLFALWRPTANDRRESTNGLVDQQRLMRALSAAGRETRSAVSALGDAAREILDWLEAHDLHACLIGGLAVQRWGEPRLTQDVDLTVLAEYGKEEDVVDALLCASRLGA
jgi:hypothetical protein